MVSVMSFVLYVQVMEGHFLCLHDCCMHPLDSDLCVHSVIVKSPGDRKYFMVSWVY